MRKKKNPFAELIKETVLSLTLFIVYCFTKDFGLLQRVDSNFAVVPQKLLNKSMNTMFLWKN